MQNLTLLKSTKLIAPALLLSSLAAASADFTPIPLTSDSYNQDVVVERTAPPPVLPATTATMDSGGFNTNFTWYERGYRNDSPITGLLPAGSLLTSEAVADHEYQFAPSYAENNVILINSGITNGTFTLEKAAAYTMLSFLVSGGNGGGAVGYTIHYEDGTTQTNRLTCEDWLNGPNPAFTAGGRVNVSTYLFVVDTINPRLYAQDVVVTQSSVPIVSIEFSYTGGSGQRAIFAVSGVPYDGGGISPIRVSGYNADVVVEASATKPDVLSGATTASMDDGTANVGNTWYERGYYPPKPMTGLPPAGSEVTSACAPDHHYVLASSYAANDAVLLDVDNRRATVSLAVPTQYSALSFLTSAGHGPVTNRCIVNYADGSSQTNNVVSPDWLDAQAAALCGNGRVKLSKRLIDAADSDYPRLYSVDLALENTSSPVKELLFDYVGGPLYSHAAIFAVSGAPVSSPPPVLSPATLSIIPASDGGWILSSSVPGTLQSATVLKGRDTAWKDEGSISTAVKIGPTAGQPSKFYRVRSP